MLYFKCRSTFSCLLVVLLGAPSLFAQDDEGELSKMQQDFFAAAQSIQVRGGSTGSESLELLPRGALSWSNPERRTAAGGLFLWTLDGRPQVAMCIYPSTPTTFDHEFQSLSLSSLSASVNDESIWEPLEAGIEFLPLEKVAPPGASVPVRLRQMRNLAREFSAKLVPPERAEIPLRLFSAPTYRYPPPDPSSEIIDGAMFTFVQGTDPEVFLIIEAIQDAKQGAAWRYALARMTMVPMQVRHRTELVWETEWAQTKNRNNPYYVIKKYGRDDAETISID
jgi:hypothetical protein